MPLELLERLENAVTKNKCHWTLKTPTQLFCSHSVKFSKLNYSMKKKTSMCPVKMSHRQIGQKWIRGVGLCKTMRGRPSLFSY